MTVTGFDGIPDALARGLTTVKQPSIEKGSGRPMLHNPPRSGLPTVEVLDTEVARGRKCPACRRCAAARADGAASTSSGDSTR